MHGLESYPTLTTFPGEEHSLAVWPRGTCIVAIVREPQHVRVLIHGIHAHLAITVIAQVPHVPMVLPTHSVPLMAAGAEVP